MLPDAPAQPEPPGRQLWWEFVNEDHGLCGLCGNTGWIDTRGRAVSPAGVECGVLKPCICPNGRAAKRKPEYGRLTLAQLEIRRAAAAAGGSRN